MTKDSGQRTTVEWVIQWTQDKGLRAKGEERGTKAEGLVTGPGLNKANHMNCNEPNKVWQAHKRVVTVS